MSHRRSVCTVVVIVAAVMASGCTGGDPQAVTPAASSSSAATSVAPTAPRPSPSANTAPSVSSSPTTGFDWSVSSTDKVTEAYVQRVLDAIFHVEGESIRLEAKAASDGATAPPRAAVDVLPAIYDGEKLTTALIDVGDHWRDGELTVDYAEDPGDPIPEVRRIVDVAPGCIIVRFWLDDQPTVDRPAERYDLIALLNPKPDGVDASAVNPSPWVIAQEAIMNDNIEASCDA